MTGISDNDPIEIIEKAAVERLKAAVLDLPVVAFPDSPEDFKKLPFQKGIVLVGYQGSRFSQPTNLDVIIQERVLQFGVTLQIRDLRGHDGAYRYLEAIRASLTGFAPEGDYRAFYPVSEDFLNMTNNVWIYGMSFELRKRQA